MSEARRSAAAIHCRPTGHADLRFDRRSVIGGLITFAAPGILSRPVSAAATHSLIMVEDDGCVYCVRWHKEVGDAYANSAEGRFAPLDRRRIKDSDIAFLRNLRYTPTFVLVRGDEEIGRITGYPGADFFWQLLAELMAKAGFKDTPAAAPVDDIKT
jgi:thioredoxin-related protein